MKTEELKVGMIIRGKRWKEPVEIRKIENLNEYVHLSWYK